MAASTKQLRPEPHFGLTSLAGDDRHVARVVVRDEEMAAILDGVTLSEPAVTAALLRLVMAEVAQQIHNDLTEGNGWEESTTCADDLQVLAARLPLAARIHKFLTLQRDDAGMSMAESEGWDADIRERFVGKISGFTINGVERDALVREVRAELKMLKGVKGAGAKEQRRELKAILADTGREKGTGEACTLATAAMPTLVEWTRRLGPDVTSQGFHRLPRKKRRRLQRRHGLIRDMWLRLRGEIEAGPKAVV